MSTSGNSKKKKKRGASYYYDLTISNDPKSSVKSRRYTHAMLRIFEIVISILVITIIGFVGYVNYTGSVTREREGALLSNIEQLQNENAALKSENEQLGEKITILSETVNQKTEVVAQIEEKSLPTGFPLSGTAELEEKQEELRLDGETVSRPMIEFKATDGTYVIAAGDGTVSLVAEESTYGWEVRIDHDNGYVTIYRTNTEPKVKQGDEIPRGGLIFEIEKPNGEDIGKVAYQILKDEEYIEPTEMLKIEG
ncbi:MAG: peptidoglycan DD-metalloendopeptidase family protein [Lachnospiraceae bacterium]|nr:peptidoglycan DD-metalloendopeptidase family protein [Lachnospiraceae bacterium]